ncbi:MAG: glucose-1-phosphate adenylyltransferase subunit GlgD [Bacillota bacterium]|nr:glucose-1-phosphate adenylyltransferase subunit GlgD [Bacillota bacterium]
MANNVIGILDFHNAPSLGEVTDSRTVGSTSFLGRYAFMDFAMSNFTNSGIETVGVLIKEHPRSVLKHMRTMSSWVSNTKIGRSTIMYNEKGVLDPATNTDLANINENDWVIFDSNADYIVIQPTHIVCNLDLRPILNEHIARNEKITVVTTKVKDASKEFSSSNILRVDGDGYVISTRANDGKTEGPALVSMETWIINRTVLADMCARRVGRRSMIDEEAGIKEMIDALGKSGIFKIHTYEFKGYVRCFDSFEHFMDYSFELFDREVFMNLFNEYWPHYTLTHDTPPALYGEDSAVNNSFISNGAIVEGKVENSIISRDVRIGKGSTVKNCIVLSNVSIGENCHIENMLVDKYAIITKDHVLKGDKHEYVYLRQGAIV